MILKLFIAFSFLISVSYGQTSVVDFCVADYSVANGPAGYSCKNTSKVITDDFILTGLGVKGSNFAFYTKIMVSLQNRKNLTFSLGLSCR